MARRSVLTHRGQRTAKRFTSWAFGTGGVTVQTISSTGKTILGSGLVLAAGMDVATIVRTRGYLFAGITGAGAALDSFHCAFGVAIVSTEAFVAGVASIPGPLTELDWNGWMVHQTFKVMQKTTISDDNFGPGTLYTSEVDSKAMRKFNDNETLVAVLEVVEVGTGPSMRVMWDSRILLKLH